MSGWISPGSRGLDSLIGKVAGQEMRVSEKGDRNLRPKWKRPRAWVLYCGRDRLPPGRPGELESWGRAPAGNDKKDEQCDGSRLARAAFAIANAGIGIVGDGGRVGGQGGNRPLGHGPRASKPGPAWTEMYRDIQRPQSARRRGGGDGGEPIDHRRLSIRSFASFTIYHGASDRSTSDQHLHLHLHLALESSRVESNPPPRRSTVIKVLGCTACRLPARPPALATGRPVPSSPVQSHPVPCFSSRAGGAQLTD